MKFADVFLLPNLITLSRFFLSLYLFFNFTSDDFSPFTLIVLIVVIGLSDSLDGIVARRYNLVSKLGVILDPMTDRAVFIILLFWLSNTVPSSVIYSVLIRELLVLLGSLYVLLTGKKINVSIKGKIGTVALFVLLCLFVLSNAIYVPYLNQLAIIVIIFYFYVAIEYLYNLIYKSG